MFLKHLVLHCSFKTGFKSVSLNAAGKTDIIILLSKLSHVKCAKYDPKMFQKKFAILTRLAL